MALPRARQDARPGQLAAPCGSFFRVARLCGWHLKNSACWEAFPMSVRPTAHLQSVSTAVHCAGPGPPEIQPAGNCDEARDPAIHVKAPPAIPLNRTESLSCKACGGRTLPPAVDAHFPSTAIPNCVTPSLRISSKTLITSPWEIELSARKIRFIFGFSFMSCLILVASSGLFTGWLFR